MKYFESGADSGSDPSELTVVWTNQHGCGVNDADNPNKLNCQILLQFMCCDDEGGCGGGGDDPLRDGTDSSDLQFDDPGPR